jgi:D-aspartate ligase
MSFRVALVGPDGTGKSHVCRRLCAELPWPTQYLYMGINYEASNVMLPTTWLLRQWKRFRGTAASMGGPPPIGNPQPKGLRRVFVALKSLIRTPHLVTEEWFRQFACWIAQLRGKIVVMDRHFLFDYYAHHVAPRFRRQGWASYVHGWVLKRLYPRPDLVIFLDGDVATLFARKPEGTMEQLSRRRQEYIDSRQLCPRYVVIDATQPLDDVVRLAKAAVCEFHDQQRLAATARRATLSSQVVRPPIESQGRSVATRTPAVIVGQDCYTGLQTARILAARGIPVIGVAENPRHFGCRTRSCQRIIAAPLRTEALIERLEQLAADLPTRPVLIPCVDMSVLLIARHRQRLEKHFHIALPDAPCVASLMDKSAFHQFAVKHGFSVPQTYTLRNRNDAELAAQRLTYPCLLKPSLKTDLWETTVRTKVFRVNSAAELLQCYEQIGHAASEITAQQWIEGADSDLFTCNCYFGKDGQPLVTFLSQKLRQWPNDIGVATLGQECRDEEVRETTLKLFQAARFRGLGYLEMKRDRRTGELVLIEANIGRPTGRSALAEASGVELLATMYCDLLDLPLPEARRQQYRGNKWIYWRKDLRAAFHCWRRGELTPLAWWRSIRGTRTPAIFSWRDPMPFVMDMWSAVFTSRRSKQRSLETVSQPERSLIPVHSQSK